MRSTTTRESEWNEQQRAYVQALAMFEKSQCSGCGGYLPDTTDAEAKFEAKYPHRCFRCEAVANRQREYKDSKNPQALVLWPVEQTRGGARG